MLGFGNKKQAVTPEPESQGRVQTIPDIFYGGNDPDVYRRTVVSGNSETRKVAAVVPKASPVSAQVAQANHHGLWWGVGGVGLIAAIGGITWYYTSGLPTNTILVANKPTTTVVVVNPPIVTPIETPVVTTTVDVATTTPSAPTSTVVAGGPLEFAALNPLNTVDFDRDSLTDAEEELFGTDPAAWDTEKDGYYDGQEVFNLYNPIGMAPVRLIDSGTVLEYTNSVLGYSLYYPKTWTVAAVDAESRQVIVTAANGDYIEIRALNKTLNEDFNTWFARNIVGQNITDLLQASNRFEVPGWRRRDDLVAYFMGQNDGFVIMYHPLSGGPVAYRHIIQMVAQSFRLGRVNSVLPEQPILPGVVESVPAVETVTTTTAVTTTAFSTSTL